MKHLKAVTILLEWSQKNKKAFLLFAGFVLILFLIPVFALNAQGYTRNEIYKDISGSAGLDAVIDYDCEAECQNKYEFDIHMFSNNGRQVGVFRPDKEGRVQMALTEGEYVMFIGKQMGSEKTFPQESLSLKNGKLLELRLEYK